MDRLKIGAVSRNYFNMPLWGMHHGGFLRDEGIEADIHLIESIDEVSDRLASHDLDLALSVTENVILEREQGGDLVILGGNVNRLPFSFVARPGIGSIADLKGKRIGVSSKAAGSSSLIMRILDGHGLRYPDDYTLVDCGPILKRWEMLQSGEIDAGLQGVPLNHIALDAGYVDLGNPREAFPDFQFTSLNASRAWIEEHDNLLHRALRAFLRAHEWFYTDKAATIDVARKETGISADYAARAWDEYVEGEIFPRDGTASFAAVQTLIEVSGLIRALPKRQATGAAHYIDHSYLEAARVTL